MTRRPAVDPVLSELVREIARAPRSPIFGFSDSTKSVVESLPSGTAEHELFRVYRTQAASLWCDAALDCLLQGQVGKEVLFVLPKPPFQPLNPARLENELALLTRESQSAGPLELLQQVYRHSMGPQGVSPTEALRLANVSLSLFPTARALLVVTDVHMHLGQLQEAERVCRRGLQISVGHKERAQFLERLAVCARRRGNLGGYHRVISRAHAIDGDNTVVVWNRLRAGLELGLFEDAIKTSEALDRCIEKQPWQAGSFLSEIKLRKRSRGTIASLALHEGFAAVRLKLALTSRGMIDAFI